MADKDAGMVFDAGSLKLGDYLDGWLDSIMDTLRRYRVLPPSFSP